MKKAVQYSDKFGMIVEDGEEPKARVTPGITMEKAATKVAKTTAKAETKSSKTTMKAEAKVAKKADDTTDNE